MHTLRATAIDHPSPSSLNRRSAALESGLVLNPLVCNRNMSNHPSTSPLSLQPASQPPPTRLLSSFSSTLHVVAMAILIDRLASQPARRPDWLVCSVCASYNSQRGFSGPPMPSSRSFDPPCYATGTRRPLSSRHNSPLTSSNAASIVHEIFARPTDTFPRFVSTFLAHRPRSLSAIFAPDLALVVRLFRSILFSPFRWGSGSSLRFGNRL